QQDADVLAQRRIVLDHQDAAYALVQLLFQGCDRLDHLVACSRLQGVADRAQVQCRLRMVGNRYDVNGDMPRGRIALEPLEHHQPRVVRQPHVQENAAGLHFTGEAQALVCIGGVDAIEIELVRQVVQDLGKGVVILDDENQARPPCPVV